MSQKALTLPVKFGEWTIGQVPIPEPGPNQVLVKVEATALNPADWKIRKFGVLVEEYPAVLGWDAAGSVEKVGTEVSSLKKGDRIVFQTSHTFAQYATVDADITARVPDNISFEQAASVPTAFLTVALPLYSSDLAAFPPPWADSGASSLKDRPAFIIGGSSSVGQNAIQFAKLAGHTPIVTTASAHHTALLTSLGATHVLPRTLPHSETLQKLSAITRGAPVPYVYDAVDADTFSLAYAALAPGGTLVTVAFGDPLAGKAPSDGKRVVTVVAIVSRPEHRAFAPELYRHLTGWLESGALKPNPVEILPGGLAGIPAGLARLEAGKVSGTKLVARPHETAA